MSPAYQIKETFSNIAQPLHEEAVLRGYSFLNIISKKSVIISEAFLVAVSILSFEHKEIHVDHIVFITKMVHVMFHETASRNLLVFHTLC